MHVLPGMNGTIPPDAHRLDARDVAIVNHVAAGRATIRSCGDAAGLSSSHTAWRRIRRLIDIGLLAHTPGHTGDLRLAVRRVA